ncbi:MAG: hypothetical protein RPT10_05730 [SAR324 cluster bacterium]
MNEIRRKKRSKKRGKSKNKEFMDAALDAFIRDQSLQKWNEVEGLREGAEINVMQAVKSSSEFLVKGPYRKIWVSWWKQDVIDHLPGSNEHLFAQIENAVRGAVLEEREVRKNRADALLEDSFEYKEFIARQMEHLLFEAGGDIEEDI